MNIFLLLKIDILKIFQTTKDINTLSKTLVHPCNMTIVLLSQKEQTISQN